MTNTPNAIYKGTVTHKRLRPVKHGLSYGVFNLLLDCDEIDDLAGKLKFFSHNKPNLVSIYDKDHGDSKQLGAYLRELAKSAVPETSIASFKMLAYPRVFGYAFNPLTVYFGLDDDGKIRLMVYEVNNTFGQRHTYVIPAEQRPDGMIWQNCEKQFYVSPFNDVSGNYTFHVTPIAEKLTVGVALRDNDGPILNAFFAGHRQPFSDGQLIKAIIGTGWMTVKVMAGIHIEALKLWFKGMKIKPRPEAPKRSIEIVKKKTNPAE
ncbi:DUF1365 domain-containing protein [Maritalea sp.]|uniref:DUF1365 domain-containing protein n=1 Tax=Maritalea sp. TaxID=2003361 RepID=UPI003EF45CFD